MAFLCDKCLEVLPENVLHCERCYPNGVVLFEGVTKEAHDKLKEQHALLAAENKRLREALDRVRAALAAWEDAAPECVQDIRRALEEGSDG